LATTDDARVHYAVLKIRAVPAPQPVTRRGHRPWLKEALRPFPQDPTACSAWPVPGVSVPPASGCTNWPGQLPRPNNQCSTSELPPRNTRPSCGSGRGARLCRGAPGAP
jgi:hypothetical protein